MGNHFPQMPHLELEENFPKIYYIVGSMKQYGDNQGRY
jgi:hypothetical protein